MASPGPVLPCTPRSQPAPIVRQSIPPPSALPVSNHASLAIRPLDIPPRGISRVGLPPPPPRRHGSGAHKSSRRGASVVAPAVSPELVAEAPRRPPWSPASPRLACCDADLPTLTVLSNAPPRGHKRSRSSDARDAPRPGDDGTSRLTTVRLASRVRSVTNNSCARSVAILWSVLLNEFPVQLAQGRDSHTSRPRKA